MRANVPMMSVLVAVMAALILPANSGQTTDFHLIKHLQDFG
jgi:hypothetical protein